MLTGLGGKIMTYDGENRPLSVTHLGKRTCYVYGVDGKRLKKVEGLPPTQDCTALPANVNATVYFGVAEIRNWKVAGQEQVLTYPHPAVKLLNGVTPAAATYLHRDGLSSVRAITNAAGAKIESALYKPFGEQSEWVLPGNAAPETKGWIGERYDADAGLQYLNARYYDPELSLFLQPDWFEVTKAGVGTNRFSYSFNDPVNGFDPNGNETCNADGNGCRPDENDPPPCEDSGNCDHSGDWIPTAFDIAVDFIPIIGDAKGIYEAEGVLDTLGAVASAAIGPFGDAIKVARKLDKAAKAASRARNATNAGTVAHYGPLNQGPLPNDIARTFRSGTYQEVITSEPTTLYRVISDNGNPGGGYWTRTRPEGPFQSVIDSALDQNWGNTATRVVQMDVPAGTRIFEGVAAPQRGLVGGGNQIYFDRTLNPLDPSWIK